MYNMLLSKNQNRNTGGNNNLFLTVIPFLKVNIEDFLRQAATDRIHILNAPPSTTTPSLQAGDLIRNALIQLITLLQRVDGISYPKFTKPNQDSTPAPIFTKRSKDPTPAPMFTQQQIQQFTNNNSNPHQRVQ